MIPRSRFYFPHTIAENKALKSLQVGGRSEPHQPSIKIKTTIQTIGTTPIKTSSILLKSRTSFFCTLALAAVIILGPANTRTQAQGLITGFEEAEGFETGTVNGQEGWETNVDTDKATIVDDYAYEGTQSLRIAAGNSDWAGSPLLTSEGYDGISFWLSNPDATPTANARLFRFHISLGEVVGGVDTVQRSLQFQISYQSDANTIRYNLSYDAWEGGANASKSISFLQTLLDADDWTEFRLTADPDTLTYSVSIGDAEVLSAIALGGTVTSDSSIYRVQFRSHGDLVGASYYDNVTAIPEPSPLALLGGCALAVLLLSRRRRASA